MIELKLPYPVSANRYWRNFRGRMVRSADANKYKQQVKLIWDKSNNEIYGGNVSVNIKYHPKQNMDGRCSKVRYDVDNVIKVILDSLNGLAYADDKQIVFVSCMVDDCMPGGGVTVGIYQ